ncbi:MAG: cytochrome c oxidase subunit I [Chloroflexi bacterium UTCFX4]|nr:MAG: cytochrome c oxidase subunit I [Chloroflexi bacterium UTCFX4]
MATNVLALPRASQPTGLMSWITTVDHKRIGILYLITAVIFFIVGGIEALIIRTQLAAASNTLVGPNLYNELFTMHGTTMIFLAVMPLNSGFGNYLVPLMIGARDMAFPRLNALGYWLFLFGGLLLYSSFLVGGAPDAGWFGYAPLSERAYSPTHGVDFWILSLQLLGISSIVGSLNFIVTIINMRAPGMTINRLPLLVWGTLVTSLLVIFALPSVSVAMFLLLFDRVFSTSFYLPNNGGDPLLWQHLFWFFGHPEVYIMIMPPFGIISEILATNSRKPIFGYAAMAFAFAGISFVSFTVWAHHMFAVGMSPAADAVFAGMSFVVAVPTGIKIFNWLATIWRGSLRINSAFLFAAGFIGQFTIGGLSGVILAAVPVDWQVTDTYFVIGHFHYTLFAGAVLALFAGTYYWFPKMTGRFLNERLGQLHFWFTMVGMTLVFLIMHYVGVLGMPRRIYTYGAAQGWEVWNFIETIGAYLVAFGVLFFIINIITSLRHKATAPNDPWDGQTLEWATSSPPPAYNFASMLPVNSPRPLWDAKYGPHGEFASNPKTVDLSGGGKATVHLPSPSIWPLVLTIGLSIIAIGIIFGFDGGPLALDISGMGMALQSLPIGLVTGIVVFFIGLIGWVSQPAS